MSRSKLQLAVGIALTGVLLLATVAHAQGGPPGPTGAWVGTDLPPDSSTIRWSLGGPPSGPWDLTWTDDFWSLCDGGPGIGRGTAELSEGNLVEINVDFECFTTDDTAAVMAVYEFDQTNQTLTLVESDPGAVALHSLSRPGGP